MVFVSVFKIWNQHACHYPYIWPTSAEGMFDNLSLITKLPSFPNVTLPKIWSSFCCSVYHLFNAKRNNMFFSQNLGTACAVFCSTACHKMSSEHGCALWRFGVTCVHLPIKTFLNAVFVFYNWLLPVKCKDIFLGLSLTGSGLSPTWR